MGMVERLCGGKVGLMIRIQGISLTPQSDSKRTLTEQAAALLKTDASKIKELKLVRRSIDARKKQDVRIIYTVDVRTEEPEDKLLRRFRSKRVFAAKEYSYDIEDVSGIELERPVVVGFGPAGMFAALVLAKAGAKPIVLERGADALSRREKVEHFWSTGQLDPECNVQFGEGGAGTFSDGKLTTGIKNPRIRWILEQFVRAGAQESILYDAKPHIGTDILIEVVQNLRNEIIRCGGEVRFNTKVTGLRRDRERLAGVVTPSGELPCSAAIFAIGHSARDTFAMLYDFGIPMEPKAFSMGVRIEHLQSDINISQYGDFAPYLEAADYKLVCHLPGGESVYTFCMCPGGEVVAATSESGGVVTNGMSRSKRDGKNANSAVLVSLRPEDFPYMGALGGVKWQRELEERAYAAGGADYRAPAQRVEDFLLARPSTAAGKVKPSYRPGVKYCDLHDVLPEKISRAIELALPELEKKLKGFADPDALMTAPETRSSSPVRILRDERMQSSLRGFYPCGEGAGYAGGILSAAVDGMLCAEEILRAIKDGDN